MGIATKTIVVTASKGGAGKTVLAASLACWLANQGSTVDIVDTDEGQTEGSLSTWFDDVERPAGLDVFVATAAELADNIGAVEADYVIVDSPPRAGSADLPVLLGVADLVVYVGSINERRPTSLVAVTVADVCYRHGIEAPPQAMVISRTTPGQLKSSAYRELVAYLLQHHNLPVIGSIHQNVALARAIDGHPRVRPDQLDSVAHRIRWGENLDHIGANVIQLTRGA